MKYRVRCPALTGCAGTVTIDATWKQSQKKGGMPTLMMQRDDDIVCSEGHLLHEAEVDIACCAIFSKEFV